MYFPYLRSKQFELIALREFAMEFPNNHCVIPIIEPVKSTFNSLTTAVKVMFDRGLRFSLILNPTDGDFRRKRKEILSEIPILTQEENEGKWIPAFGYTADKEELSDIIKSTNLKDVMIVFKNGVETTDEMMGFLSDSHIRYIVNGDSRSRIAVRRLLQLENKSIIRLDSGFIEQRRNVDYLNISEDKFTEEHRFYRVDGFYGLSDYTVLPKDFIDGGMLPYAVAIHMTYEKNESEIFVRHFVSDTNEDQSNIQRKFFEAASKLKGFFADKVRTPAIDSLIQLLDENKYPGLGVIKKLSIRNHMELMNRILSE